jgi:hypothetical protein
MAHTHTHPHLHVSHPHVPDIRGDEQGSPWLLLPGVALVLALLITVLTVACFAIAHMIAGHAY